MSGPLTGWRTGTPTSTTTVLRVTAFDAEEDIIRDYSDAIPSQGDERMIYRYQDIRVVHLEVTDKCNAACPMCPRTGPGGAVNPHLPLVELRLDDIKAIFPDDFVRQLDHLYMCGSFGDPLVARDTLEIFRHLRRLNPAIRLGMNTNGSGRKPEWWAALAESFQGPLDAVVFSIDGLSTTNHIYRRHTQWEKIMANTKAFVGAGGRATWDFIVFRHNEHQVDQARQLAKSLGFAGFQVKLTARFNTFVSGETRPYKAILGRDGKEAYRIHEPENPEYRAVALDEADSVVARYGSLAAYYDSTAITCQAARRRSLYIRRRPRFSLLLDRIPDLRRRTYEAGDSTGSSPDGSSWRQERHRRQEAAPRGHCRRAFFCGDRGELGRALRRGRQVRSVRPPLRRGFPSDPRKTSRPGGVRIAATEVIRLGMGTAGMAAVFADFRRPFQTVHYCFEAGPPG